MAKHKVLIVDDEAGIRTRIAESLRPRGFDIIEAATVEEAKNRFRLDYPIAVAILDISLPDGDGIELGIEFGKMDPDIIRVVLTGHGDKDKIITCLRNGFHDFLEKPAWDAFPERWERVERVLELSQRGRAYRQSLAKIASGGGVDRIVGDSVQIKALRERAALLASKNLPVLIWGESGSGKEEVAKAIHFGGTRAGSPYMGFQLDAIASTLIESEIFGTLPGAFSGAVDKEGLLEMAGEGTLALDELQAAPIPVQAKLLRVLEERKFMRVGRGKEIQFHARVVGIVNEDPETLVDRHELRRDLYFRLKGEVVKVPPLREAREDIPRLVSHFMERAVETEGKNSVQEVSAQAIEALMAYDWPGNRRELWTTIWRAYVLAGEAGRARIDKWDLPGAMTSPTAREKRGLEAPTSVANAPLSVGRDDPDPSPALLKRVFNYIAERISGQTPVLQAPAEIVEAYGDLFMETLLLALFADFLPRDRVDDQPAAVVASRNLAKVIHSNSNNQGVATLQRWIPKLFKRQYSGIRDLRRSAALREFREQCSALGLSPPPAEEQGHTVWAYGVLSEPPS